MSSADLNFHAQVESVLSKLVKVATMELTNLFETRYLAFAGDAVKSDERHETLPKRECVEELGGKAVSCSIGVQVNGQSNETAKLCGPRNLSGRRDCLRGGEEQGGSTTDPLTGERNGHGDRLGILVKEKENQSTVGGEAPTALLPTPPHRAEDAIGREPHSPAAPPPSRCTPGVAEARSHTATEDSAPPTPPPFPKPEPQDPKVDPPEPTVRPEPRQTEERASPLPLLEKWECVSPSKEDTPNDLQMKLKRAGRPQHGVVRPCSVRLVNIEAAAASAAAAAAKSPGGSSSSPPPKDLRRHQGMHTGHRLCCYTACNNGVWRLQGVVAHTRGGYPCAACGKTFKRRKILRRHERFHTGERPYACPRCPKAFALRKSLRRHQRFHTGERPHDCAKCGKSFRLRENLKAHLRFHSGEKPYACTVCKKTFRIARNLEKHTVDQCGFKVPSFRHIAGLVG